ncbi:phage portal protein [Lactobacillus crispatus]|uniref:phage portal protein n=1 Tax=Lactobacillus crispatus TaxID=47770 RepID=UPI0001B29C19|nr:phage portal protein [Lactobacillus crispatus]EEU19750.1 phage portal protein, HK97 family [Lactobacillus crispatus 125-2-CHN]
MGLLSRASPYKIKNMMTTVPATHGLVFTQLIGDQPLNLVSTNQALLNSDIFSVINRISSDIASARFKTADQYVYNLLNTPNRLISRFSFWQSVIIQLLLDGNSYVPIKGMSLEQRRPSEVSEINVLDDYQGLTYKITPFNGEKEFTLTQDQILHFRIMPDSRYQYMIGMSPLESLTYEMTISADSRKATLNSIKNQISPIGILTVPASQLNDEDREVARKSFEKANSGENNGRLMVLTADSKFSQLDVKADVFKALNENANFSASQISKAFGIPVDMLGGGQSTESQHSNIDSVKGNYISDLNSYINPILDELKLKFNCPDLKLDVKSALDVDDSLTINQVNSMLQAGAIDQEQAQQLLKKSGALPLDLIPFTSSEGGENDDQN